MQNINVTELHQLMQANKVELIDVREEFEYKAVNIAGAHLIPLATINASKLPKTDKPIVIHCKLGGRSTKACQQLLAEDPSLNLASLDGGITAWESAGLPVNKQSLTIPVERQTQIAIGLIILLGSMLGYTVHQNYFFIPTFMGAGLIFAGISGFCGMAKVIAKMPWNN